MYPDRHEGDHVAINISVDVSVSGEDRDAESHEGDAADQLLERFRSRGSFQEARDLLNHSAQIIGNRIAAAIPNQTWRIDDDPHGLLAARMGSSCDELPGDVARRPQADPIVFGRTFSADEFALAAEIVRLEAAQYGATETSSLFNEAGRRDFDAYGNGYEFNLGQINFAALTIIGQCRLLQKALDKPLHGPPARRAVEHF